MIQIRELKKSDIPDIWLIDRRLMSATTPVNSFSRS
jgi:hypothetical protein